MSTIRIKGVKDETFQDYKKPSMLISTISCTWKCCIEGKFPITTCQNMPIAQEPTLEVGVAALIERYLRNPLTSAIIFGGLEPLLQVDEIYQFLRMLRYAYGNNDDVVIYTGYEYGEVRDVVDKFREFINVIIKFGRYVPTLPPKYDKVLGVQLISCNQYATKIS